MSAMDVAVTDLRAHLSEWLNRARAGGEVVITDRGVPVARLVGLAATTTLERLTAEGVIGQPASARRPTASGRSRPRPRRPLSEVVSDQRR
jgi:prevent-host-death family protein